MPFDVAPAANGAWVLVDGALRGTQIKLARPATVDDGDDVRHTDHWRTCLRWREAK